MIHIETLRVALASLRAHLLRTFLTLLGVIIGVTTVVTVVSIISGLNAYIEERVFTLGADSFVLTKFGIITNRDELMDALRRRDLTLEDLEAVERLCRGCVFIGADIAANRGVSYEGERLSDVPVHGSTANITEVQNLELDGGRFFNEAEEHHSRPVAVIGSDVRDALFPGIDPVGRAVKIDGFPYKVVGLLRKQGTVLGQNLDKTAYIPLPTYQKSFGARRSVNIVIKASGPGTLGPAQEEVRAIMRARRNTPYDAADPFGFVTADALNQLWQQISGGAFALMAFISGISLIVGGIVIMNIMLVSVAERTQEIGVRRALGARRGTIRIQFMMEATLMAAAGGAIGVALGAGVAALVERFSPVPVAIRPQLIFQALLLATLVGVASGLFPSMKAARLQPTEALRSE